MLRVDPARLDCGANTTVFCFTTSMLKGPLVEALQIALQILLGVTSLLLTLLILLHKGRGGGLSDMFGGGMSSNLGSSGVAERNLNRFTVVLGIVWGIVIIGLGLVMSYGNIGG